MPRLMTWTVTFLVSFYGVFAGAAASQCHFLTRKQAAKAVEISQIALGHGGNFLIQSKNESGILRPLGVWSEIRRDRKGHQTSIIRIDDREVDISLIYVARTPSARTAYNLAWLSGCRPGSQQPVSVPNY